MMEQQQKLEPEKYAEFFSSVENDVKKIKFNDISQQVISVHKIRILKHRQGKFYNDISKFGDSYIEVRGYKEQGASFIYDVVLGQFLLRINVLNINRDAEYTDIPQQEKLGQGGFGVVRKVQLNNKKIAVKRIYLQNRSHNEIALKICPFDKAERYTIQKAIRQYCIYKICSMLEIGPMVIFQESHDLICYNDCIEFVMELCQNPKNNPNSINDSDFERDLKFSTRLMHIFGFVHRDIKPANILYSTNRKKFVLGDFGITHTVAQSVGQKTITSFSGTFQYVSDQLMQLYGKWGKGLVDLYLNDMVALKATLRQLSQLKKVRIQTFSSNAMSYQQSQSYMQPISNSQGYQQNTLRQSQHQENQYTGKSYQSIGNRVRSRAQSLDSNFLTQQTNASILNEYNCQINFYINSLIYQILFNELDYTPQLIIQLINDLCKRQQNTKISEYLTARIGKILWVDLQQMQVQRTKSPKQMQENLQKRFIIYKQNNRYQIQKQKLQYFLRHYGFTQQCQDLIQNILASFPQLDPQQVKLYQKMIKETQKKQKEKEFQMKQLKLHVQLFNYHQQTGFIRKKINKFKKLAKQNKQISQRILDQLRIEYIALIGTNAFCLKQQQQLANKSFNELFEMIPQNLKIIAKLPKQQSSLPSCCHLKCRCSFCQRNAYCQLVRFAFGKICEALQNPKKNSFFWKNYQISFLSSLQVYLNLGKYEELLVCIDKLEKIKISQQIDLTYRIDLFRTIIYLKCQILKRLWEINKRVEIISFDFIEIFSKKKILININDFEIFLRKISANKQQQEFMMCRYLSTCYQSFARCLVVEGQYRIAEQYLKKSMYLKQILYYPSKTAVQLLSVRSGFIFLYLHEEKYQLAKAEILDALKYIKKSEGITTKLPAQIQFLNNLAFIYQKQGNYQQALKLTKLCYTNLLLVQAYHNQKIIYYVDNIILFLILLGRTSQIKQYALISIKLKISFAQYYFKCIAKKIITNQQMKNLLLFSKAIDLSLVEDKITDQGLIAIYEMYIPLINNQYTIFKSQLKFFCERAAQYYYKQKKYLKFMKYIYIYLINIDISKAQQHDFYRYDAYIKQLMKKNMYRRALKMLKKYIFYIPDNMKQVRDLAFKKLMQLHRQLQLPQADIFKQIYQQKLYVSRQYQYIEALFKWKYRHKPHFSKKLLVLRKMLKMI